MKSIFALALLALFAAHGALAQPAYVVNGTANTVSVIDTATNTIVGLHYQAETAQLLRCLQMGVNYMS
jgi:hypothetical protein